MRYQSFYPFASNQSPLPPLGQSGFGMPPFPGQPPLQGPPLQGPPFQAGGMNQPFFNPTQTDPPAQSTSKIDSYMQTANNFLNTAQQFAPVVQQFAPMVQNLPAMWKLYKGFQSLPDANPTGGSVASAASQSTARNTASTPSVPRIFQPRGF